MSFEKVFDFIVNQVRAEEIRKYEKENENRPRPFTCFRADKKAGDLIESAKKQAEHHRGREKHYVTKLEEAEKELREKGISMEVYDQNTGSYLNYGSNASGNLSVGGVSTQQFQPRVDQKLLDNVKNAKAKMLEHRSKSEDYEKYARAFACNPEFQVRLSVDDILYFRLES